MNNRNKMSDENEGDSVRSGAEDDLASACVQGTAGSA